LDLVRSEKSGSKFPNDGNEKRWVHMVMICLKDKILAVTGIAQEDSYPKCSDKVWTRAQILSIEKIEDIQWWVIIRHLRENEHEES